MAKIRTPILTLLAYLIVARLSCPALSNIPFMSMGFVFIYGAVFSFLFLFTRKAMSTNDFQLIISVVLYIVFALIQIFFAGKTPFNTVAFKFYIVLFMTMILVWSKQESLKVKRNLMLIVLFASIFNYIYSLVVLYFDPNASRTAAATSVLEASPYDVLHAVGSFDAANGAIFVVIILLFMRTRIEDKKVRFLIMLTGILAGAFVIASAYVTAIVLFALALCIYISSKNKLLSLVGIVAIVLFLAYRENVADFIINFSAKLTYSDTVSSKLGEFGEMLKTMEATGTYGGEGGRLAGMVKSLQTFLRHPLFGGFAQYDWEIGGHSEMFDILGNFGIVGFGLVTFYMISLYSELRSAVNQIGSKKAINIIFFVFVVASVLNPSFYTLQMLPIILMIYFGEQFTDYYEPESIKVSENE